LGISANPLNRFGYRQSMSNLIKPFDLLGNERSVLDFVGAVC
jgi:hypothetical protein